MNQYGSAFLLSYIENQNVQIYEMQDMKATN